MGQNEDQVTTLLWSYFPGFVGSNRTSSIIFLCTTLASKIPRCQILEISRPLVICQRIPPTISIPSWWCSSMATNEKPGLSHQRIPPQKSGWKISNKPAEAKRATVRRKKNCFPTISNGKTNHSRIFIHQSSSIMIIMKPIKSGEWNKTQSDSTSITLPAALPRRPHLWCCNDDPCFGQSRGACHRLSCLPVSQLVANIILISHICPWFKRDFPKYVSGALNHKLVITNFLSGMWDAHQSKW